MQSSSQHIILPFCCPSSPIPQSSQPSKELSTFLAALHVLRDAQPLTPALPRIAASTSSSSITTSASPTSSSSTINPNNKTTTTTKPTLLPLFSPYPTTNPLPRTLILLQTTHPSPGPNQQRSLTQQYFAQLSGKDYWALQMWPQEESGSVSERRMEALWAKGGNWVGRESLGPWGGGGRDGDGNKGVLGSGRDKDEREEGNGQGGNGDRVGWKCECGREYWVRVVRFVEEERGSEDGEKGGKSLGVGDWELVD
ncbi:hypothetical protein ONS95_000502 [Cadophora gregata]|uniref:uncharacterized protein n=1 Tax=Cadophora gregata TaxID=51156 RepID=UPI0026DBFEA1|nr:uncharacterized protein ONS95_000502 [Cadophora gregata]KAK0125491.1 hypothetical protein ONS96_009328 [Cadophora gregata f. sp. sojae]KAK0128535.1 hypothetical protein ONS95_000502 [Cadophora gregata]